MLHCKLNKQLGKCFDYREISDEFGVGASTACEKVNTARNGEKANTAGNVRKQTDTAPNG